MSDDRERSRSPRLTPQEREAEIVGLPSIQATINFGGGTHQIDGDSLIAKYSAPQVTIYDARADQGRFKLHEHGFELASAPTLGYAEDGSFLDLYDADLAVKEFFPRAEQLVLQYCPDATRALAFDH